MTTIKVGALTGVIEVHGAPEISDEEFNRRVTERWMESLQCS